MLGTSNYVNYSRWNPKRSAQHAYHTGTLVFSTARAGISWHKERGASQEFISFSMDFLSILSTSSRKEDFMDIDMVKISSVFTEQSRKCVKNMIPFTIDQGDLIW